MKSPRERVVLCTATCLLLIACEKPETTARDTAGSSAQLVAADASQAGPGASADASTPTPQADFRGVVRGIVKLPAGLVVPLAVDPRESKLNAPPTEPCSGFSDSDRRVVFAAPGSQGLSPVHVALTGMVHFPPSTPRTQVVHLSDCRFQVDLVGAQVGDTVRFINDSPAVVAPAFPGEGFLSTLAPGETHDTRISTTGVSRATCSLGAYCGSTSVLTVAHPLWAVTDAAGTFRIEHVPLGEAITVHAWHPLFAESSVTLTLDANKLEQDLVLELKPLAAETPAGKAAKSPVPRPKRKPAQP